jgi:8-oxo-dGTP diphosphatase
MEKPLEKPCRLFVAAKAFIVRNGQLLLLREASAYQDGTNAGRYDVAGGRIEADEPVLDALKREVAEETGLVMTDAQIFHTSEWWPEKNNERWHIVGLFYAVSFEEGDIVLSGDHDQYIWHDLHAPLPDGVIPNLHPVIEVYKNGLRGV